MAAFAGPLILGAVWRGVTKAGAFAGLLAGGLTFIITFNAMINPAWFDAGMLRDVALWLEAESPNPWSCAAMGEVVSVLVTIVVSKLTVPLEQAHLERMFSGSKETAA